MCNVSDGPTGRLSPMAHDPSDDPATARRRGPPPERVVFLDALRLVAAVQMVQGHTLDALLATGYRSGAGFAFWSFTRGLTSSAFLLAAGLSFAVVSADGGRFEGGRRHRLRRALMLVGLGYLMHAPMGVLAGQPLRAALAEIGIVDVLQCIGVGLMALELLCIAVRLSWLRVGLALVVCAVLFVAAPALNSIEPVGWARPWLHYWSARGGSVFPLSPWLGFLFAGYGVGVLVLPSGLRTPRRRQLRGLALSSALVLSLAGLSELVLGSRDLRLGFTFLTLKLGLVLALAALLAGLLFRAARLPTLLTPLAADGSIDWSLALMRLAGSALVVPLMEELFWRSLVMRWLDEADFLAVDPARIGLRAVLFSSIAFGLEHSQWAAGMLAGLVYGWLYVRSGNLWIPIAAHAVTNAGLGVWVLATGAWYFW